MPMRTIIITTADVSPKRISVRTVPGAIHLHIFDLANIASYPNTGAPFIGIQSFVFKALVEETQRLLNTESHDQMQDWGISHAEGNLGSVSG